MIQTNLFNTKTTRRIEAQSLEWKHKVKTVKRCDCEPETMKYLSDSVNEHKIYYCKTHDCLRVPENGE